jgi:hypothetical protein
MMQIILLLTIIFLGLAQAYLPDPDNCCKHVKVRGGSFTIEGRYNLDTYNGEQVLLKDDFWGINIITYQGGRWILKEMGGFKVAAGNSSDPNTANCPENGPGLNGGSVEISCALALPWYFILLITLACLVVLVTAGCCLFWFCYCQRRRRSTSGAVHRGPPVTNSPWPASYPQQVPFHQPPLNEVVGGGWNSGAINQPSYSETKQ